jgi:hypothetical protein
MASSSQPISSWLAHCCSRPFSGRGRSTEEVPRYKEVAIFMASILGLNHLEQYSTVNYLERYITAKNMAHYITANLLRSRTSQPISQGRHLIICVQWHRPILCASITSHQVRYGQLGRRS